MSIDLKLSKPSEFVTIKYRLPKDIADEFTLYVKAAQEQMPDADDALVLSTLLRHHMKKDRAFRGWLKKSQNRVVKKETAVV